MKIVFCSITIYLRIVRFKGFVTFVFFFNRWNFLFKVIILYNSNDRETKRLNKKQLKEVENAKNLEEIKENSSERKKFKRVSLGFLIRNSYTSISVKSTNLEPLFQNCNSYRILLYNFISTMRHPRCKFLFPYHHIPRT
mgnify:CR=1 FL=1